MSTVRGFVEILVCSAGGQQVRGGRDDRLQRGGRGGADDLFGGFGGFGGGFGSGFSTEFSDFGGTTAYVPLH